MNNIDYFKSFKDEALKSPNISKKEVSDLITPIALSFMNSLSVIEHSIIDGLIIRRRLVRWGLATNKLTEYLTVKLLSKAFYLNAKR